MAVFETAMTEITIDHPLAVTDSTEEVIAHVHEGATEEEWNKVGTEAVTLKEQPGDKVDQARLLPDPSLQEIGGLQGPKMDAKLLQDLERDATRLAKTTLDTFDTLRSSLNNINMITRLSSEAYQVAVDQYSRSTDTAMSYMMQLVSQCEELDRAMVPMYELAAQ
eukprot:Ihof_evm2s520 gene=Ihof_evmTU2s520